MPTKEESQKLQELSLEVFKRKYAYTKLLTQGVVHRVDVDGKIPRRQKLTVLECIKYLEETIRMRKQIQEKLDASGE